MRCEKWQKQTLVTCWLHQNTHSSVENRPPFCSGGQARGRTRGISSWFLLFLAACSGTWKKQAHSLSAERQSLVASCEERGFAKGCDRARMHCWTKWGSGSGTTRKVWSFFSETKYLTDLCLSKCLESREIRHPGSNVYIISPWVTLNWLFWLFLKRIFEK